MHPVITFLFEIEEDELANFIDIPLFNRTSANDTFTPHRLLKIEDNDTVVFLKKRTVGNGATVSLEKREDGTTDYIFPNKTVKFFVICQMGGGTISWKIRTSNTADTADGTIRETIVSQPITTLYTSEVIEGNFNGKFLTIENEAAGDSITVHTAVIIEPA